MRIYEDFLKIKQFLMTSYPLKMTSYHSQILLIARFWVDLFEKTVVVGIQPTSCLLNFHTCTLLFDFKPEKLLQSKRKSINQTLFSTKSTTLNPMVKSDLVTYRGVTMPNLFLQATNIIWIFVFLHFCAQRLCVPYLWPYDSVDNIFIYICILNS